LLHGAGWFVGIDVAKLAAVDDQDLVRFFPGFVDPIEQLTLQFMDVFVKSRCREKQMRRIQKPFGSEIIQFQAQGAAGNDRNVGKG
jgi:hypothetical protein